MATRKAKRYDGGGVTEGENANIDDDTRARALKWVQQQSEEASSDEGSGEKTVSRSTKTKATAKPAAKAEESDPRDREAGKSRGIPGDGVPKTTRAVRMATSRGIPTRELKSGETQADYEAGVERKRKEPLGPNSASGSELERNLSAAANALGPVGASRAVRGATAAVKGTQELVASRRAAAAAQAAREARDAKVMNPNAWMAGPKGMKENFKSGGDVKGWGAARGARKAKIY